MSPGWPMRSAVLPVYDKRPCMDRDDRRSRCLRSCRVAERTTPFTFSSRGRGAMSSDVSTGQEETREEDGIMRRLILQTGISIDGYVAALDRSHSVEPRG
jgi:hypothetical protein